MLSVPDNVRALLGSHHKARTYGVALYEGASVELDIAPEGSVTFDGDGEVQATADIHVFGVGESLVPRLKTDVLAPYGQEVALYRDVLDSNDEPVYTIPLGVFRITGNSGARETVRVYGPVASRLPAAGLDEVAPGLYSTATLTETAPGSGLYLVGDLPSAGAGLYSTGAASGGFTVTDLRSVVLDWEVDVQLADRFRMLERASWFRRKSPVPGNSMYDEIRRLSLFPVEESLPDAVVPGNMTYEDRFETIRALAGLADAVPTLTRQGALTLRRKDPVGDGVAGVFEIEGVVQWDEEQSDDFVNFVWAYSDNREFNGYAQITDESNPLSVARAGMSVREHSSPLYTSNGAAQAGAQKVLDRLQRRSRVVTVECLPDAFLLELGDVGTVRQVTDGVTVAEVFGEVVGLRFPLDPTGTVQVDILTPEEA